MRATPFLPPIHGLILVLSELVATFLVQKALLIFTCFDLNMGKRLRRYLAESQNFLKYKSTKIFTHTFCYNFGALFASCSRPHQRQLAPPQKLTSLDTWQQILNSSSKSRPTPIVQRGENGLEQIHILNVHFCSKNIQFLYHKEIQYP